MFVLVITQLVALSLPSELYFNLVILFHRSLIFDRREFPIYLDIKLFSVIVSL